MVFKCHMNNEKYSGTYVPLILFSFLFKDLFSNFGEEGNFLKINVNSFSSSILYHTNSEIVLIIPQFFCVVTDKAIAMNL